MHEGYSMISESFISSRRNHNEEQTASTYECPSWSLKVRQRVQAHGGG